MDQATEQLQLEGFHLGFKGLYAKQGSLKLTAAAKQ